MISRINVSCLGPYGSDNASLDSLKSVNYIFGSNGSGKTTISEYMRTGITDDASRVEWEGPSRPVLVYNQHYVNGIFQNSSVPGVFTLGEDNIDIKHSVNVLGQDIINLEKQKENYEGVLNRKESEYEDSANAFKEKCWKELRALSAAQKKAFQGCLSRKEAFCQRILSIEVPKNFKLTEYDELESLARKASQPSLQTIALIDLPDFESLELAESCEDFSRPVVGSDDVNTARLIHELNNAGWVEKGLYYFRLKGGSTCPFCQQTTSEALANSIESYFDEDYRRTKRLLMDAVSAYESVLDEVHRLREKLPAYRNQGFDIDQVSDNLIDFDALTTANLDRMNAKLNDLGSSVIVEDTIDVRDNLAAALKKMNEQIAAHNERALHFSEFKEDVFTRIQWQCAVRLAADKKLFLKNEAAYKKAKEGLESKVFNCSDAIERKNAEREELMSRLTSSKPTIEHINRILKDLCFDNFSLDEANDGKDYAFIRQGGERANETLSEGEKTIVTFLYFLSYVKSRSLEYPVVFIDDPISSLDSNVLYFVSSLVRDLASEARQKANSEVSQLFISTHNASFHHEITHPSSGYSLSDSAFFVIRKTATNSAIEAFGPDNPVSTGYEALWQELREENRSTSVRNSIRRILETYFNFVNGLNLEETIAKLPPSDRPLGRSLLLWTHSGSHLLTDDAECTDSGDYLLHYLNVMRRIFEANNQAAHFDYMLKRCGIALESAATGLLSDSE
ncbi:AAA family ATPase [Collinsella sp. HCP3S3_B8]|uniref:AAA family ATPase n=1 Tax=Collinsella sp. HCP3S3_B8 TaxID=3438933 RepID=UPI003F8B7AD5